MTQPRHVRRHPSAERDIERQVDWWLTEEFAPIVALKFVDAIEIGLELLREHPEVGSESPWPWARELGLRQWPLHGFENHILFYRLSEDAIELVRVVHGARRLDTKMPPYA